MEYLTDVTNPLKTIDESNMEWIDILSRPDLIRGTVQIAGNRVDFSKFPSTAQKEVLPYGDAAISELKDLHDNTSGCRLMIDTNSKGIILKAQLRRAWNFKKMNAWNSHGFDFYEVVNDKYLHKTVTGPREGKNIFAEWIGCAGKPLCIYLPTYNRIQALYLGIEKGAYLKYAEDKKNILPIIFYGHSITQGAAASRSGNIFPNIVQRMTKRNIINLSCSSCCQGLYSVAEEIGKINCHSIVIDYTRNAPDVSTFRATHEDFYLQIRKYHPQTLILFMTSCDFRNWREYFEYDKIVKETYEKAVQRGENVKLIDMKKIFDENEYSYVSVDGVHMNDIGMFRVAEAIVKCMV